LVAYSGDVRDDDAVFKALADGSRRHLLDVLRTRPGLTLTELCDGLDMTRQAVSKHLAVLEEAGIVVPLRRGREKQHFLNAAPIAEIAGRWIGEYQVAHAQAMTELKRILEEER
jgi:DNA-binding transcriptional ArsR family regulator